MGKDSDEEMDRGCDCVGGDWEKRHGEQSAEKSGQQVDPTPSGQRQNEFPRVLEECRLAHILNATVTKLARLVVSNEVKAGDGSNS